MDHARYFDNAATTPLDERVVSAMLPYFTERCGNPHSLHSSGRGAMAAVDTAREQVAALIGAEDPGEIVFTSCATEANNWLLSAYPDAAVSPFEHSSIHERAKASHLRFLGNDGLAVERYDARLVSVMKINNEIGTIFNPEEFASTETAVHSDITQAAGKIEIDATKLDYASFSAHKFYGPKGVGALYAKGAQFPPALLLGGDQENRHRAGTLNVPGIVGMGAAAELASLERNADFSKARELRETVIESLDKRLEFRINGGGQVSPYILSISFCGIEGEAMVIEMDRQGFAISSGAACSSRSNEPSHVLSALQIDSEWARGTIRISFGRCNTMEAARDLARALSETAERLIRLIKTR